MVSGLRGRLDSQGQMEDDCITRVIHGGRPDDGAALIRAVKQVTAGQVAEMAGKIKLDTVYRLTGKGEAHNG